MMDALKKSFQGFDPNDLDFSQAGNWPIGVKVICYILTFVIIVVGGWHLYAIDKREQLQREIRSEADLKRKYEGKSFQVSNLEALKKQMADVAEQFAELKRQLPTEKEVPGLLDDITNLGTDNGLDIDSIALAEEQKKEFYIELPINISVKGSYHQMGQFVSGIAALPRIVTLHDYTITPLPEGVSMKISAKTYRYDESN